MKATAMMAFLTLRKNGAYKHKLISSNIKEIENLLMKRPFAMNLKTYLVDKGLINTGFTIKLGKTLTKVSLALRNYFKKHYPEAKSPTKVKCPICGTDTKNRKIS